MNELLKRKEMTKWTGDAYWFYFRLGLGGASFIFVIFVHQFLHFILKGKSFRVFCFMFPIYLF